MFHCVIVCLPTALCFHKMSLESVQYQNIIQFLYLKGKSRDEIQVELNDVHGEQSPPLPTIKRRFNEFKAGRTSVVDMEKSQIFNHGNMFKLKIAFATRCIINNYNQYHFPFFCFHFFIKSLDPVTQDNAIHSTFLEWVYGQILKTLSRYVLIYQSLSCFYQKE